MWGGASVALLITLRYYSRFMYPFLANFESYYVHSIQLQKSLENVKITWAMPKEPKEFIVPLSKFKQIHYL
jgi:hypothetical protein